MHARKALRTEDAKTADKREFRGIVYDIYVVSCEDTLSAAERFEGRVST